MTAARASARSEGDNSFTSSLTEAAWMRAGSFKMDNGSTSQRASSSGSVGMASTSARRTEADVGRASTTSGM